jgi:hypothetical protein
MSWKTKIKRWIPLCPFIPTVRTQILALRREDQHLLQAVCQKNGLPYYFREATFEQDFKDIVAAIPEELISWLPKEKREAEIAKRFEEKMPCFIVRQKETNQLLGALWASPKGFDGLPEYPDGTVFTITSRFVDADPEGGGWQISFFVYNRTSFFGDFLPSRFERSSGRPGRFPYCQSSYRLLCRRKSFISKNWFNRNCPFST